MYRQEDRANQLAQEVLSIAKGQLLVQFRFLDRALYELKPAESDTYDLATDGRHMFYRPVPLLRAYHQQQGYAVRALGHLMMHCLFRHMFGCIGMDTYHWNLACDMAAEAMLAELNIRQLRSLPGKDEREQILRALSERLHPLTAEKLYRDLLDNPPEAVVLTHLRELFEVDDHKPWYNVMLGISASEDRAASVDEGRKTNVGTGVLSGADREALSVMWREISEHLQTDLETFSKQRGEQAGYLLQSLRSLNREKTDYAAFLRRFATRVEVMRVSPDEFDYSFYTYGLSLYKDMPLIEPLEYRDDARVRELVIAIDTSGSVSGELVQAFLQKTWNIIKQQESFARRFVLHIIQCDAEIQEDAVVTTQEEFDRYIKQMVIRGLGGTDFRPVFEYVNRLRREGQLRRMKGLLYFTDGYGVYPEKMPDYQTAFIFLEKDEYILPSVPPWAMRVVLEKDEIEVMENRTNTAQRK